MNHLLYQRNEALISHKYMDILSMSSTTTAKNNMPHICLCNI